MPAGGAMTRGPRILLRQIREALGGAGAGVTPAQDRLNMVVKIIARSMVAEVCSIYLRRASGELELFATEGLNPDAVHNTRLRPGEGQGQRLDLTALSGVVLYEPAALTLVGLMATPVMFCFFFAVSRPR